jgi:integrase
VASAISPPAVEEQEIQILTAEQIDLVVHKLQHHPLYEIAMVDLDTGVRRGELLAIGLSDVELERVTVRVERSLEETKDGLRFKPPKTKRGKRTITLPPNAVVVLREHRRKRRLAQGLGKPDKGTRLFA